MYNRIINSELGISPLQPNGAPPPISAIGLGAQIAPLQDVIKAVKATFTNPLLSWNGTVAPLPSHYWELQKVKDPRIMIRSSLSNAVGISKFKKDPALLDAGPDDRWFFALRPALTKVEEETMRAVGEVWLDLEAKRWVVFDHYPELQTRQMIRFPLWTSVWKAKNGGFLHNLNHADFETTGTLRTYELLSPGLSPQWDIEVDINWMKLFIRFEYHDVHQRHTATIPPGLCLQAIGQRIDPRTMKRASGRIGGSTGARRDGAIYMLLERTLKDASDVEFGFDNSNDMQTLLDLGTSKPITAADTRRLYRANPKDHDPTQKYLLPNAWCSLGMAAKFGRDGDWDRWDSLAKRRRSDPTILDTFAGGEAPLTFHLDDFLLTEHQSGLASIPAKSRITMFDHRLAFRGQFADRMEPFWDGFLSDNYCRANELYAEAGDGFRETTFVINREGDFFVLRDKRLTGVFGKTKCLGARLAVARAPENPIGHLPSAMTPDGLTGAQLHLFPDAYSGPYAAEAEGRILAQHPDAKMCHLLVYVPLNVSKHPVHPAPSVHPIYKALLEAAKRWDQIHPAHGTTGGKDYAFAPVAGVAPGDQVVKIKHFFGPRTDGGHQLTVLLASKIPEMNDRAYVNGRIMNLLIEDLSIDRTKPSKFGVDAGDDACGYEFVLAHELGHVLGFPDEYAEFIDLTKQVPGSDDHRLHRFGQRDKAYPFLRDWNAMMNVNKLPRLRYTWSYLQFLNGRARSVLGQPYECSHRGFAKGSGMTYRHPGDERETPWTIFKEGRLKNGIARWFLYRCGDDEATVEAMFPRPSSHATVGDWIDGIVVVRIRFWFNFFASVDSDFENDVERIDVITRFGAMISKQTNAPSVCFCLERDAGIILSDNDNEMERIGIVLQPLFEFGPMPSPRDGVHPPNVYIADADIVINVVHGDAPPRNALPNGSNQFNIVDRGSVGLSPLRKCLYAPGEAYFDNMSNIGTGDFHEVALSIGLALGAVYAVKKL